MSPKAQETLFADALRGKGITTIVKPRTSRDSGWPPGTFEARRNVSVSTEIVDFLVEGRPDFVLQEPNAQFPWFAGEQELNYKGFVKMLQKASGGFRKNPLSGGT